MQGDYIAIEDNLVHSNTWWGSSAESAIVIAEATHIDQEEGCGDTERWDPCVYKYYLPGPRSSSSGTWCTATGIELKTKVHTKVLLVENGYYHFHI